MGGFMFTAGLLTFYVAVTSFRARRRGVAGVMTLAGLASIGLDGGCSKSFRLELR